MDWISHQESINHTSYGPHAILLSLVVPHASPSKQETIQRN
jgi:hypothetical protein